MKRKLALTAAILFLTGCGSTKKLPVEENSIGEFPTENQTEDTASEYIEDVKNYAVTSIPTYIKAFPEIIDLGEKMVLFGGYNDEQGNYYQLFSLYDKKSGTTTESVEYSDMECQKNMIGFSQTDSGYEAVYKAAKEDIQYFVTEYSENLDVVSEKTPDMTDIEGWLIQSLKLENGEYIALESTESCTKISFFDANLKLKNSLSDTLGFDCSMTFGADKKIYFADENGVYYLDGVSVIPYETELSDISKIICGDKEFPIYAYNKDGIFGIRDGRTVKVLDWAKCDIRGDFVQSAGVLPDGKFISGSMNDLFCVYTPCEKSENSSEIRLSTIYDSDDLYDAVKKFNRCHDTKIVVDNLRNEEQEIEDAVQNFEQQLITGGKFDIVCLEFMPYENYVSKEIFGDLSDKINLDGCLENFYDAAKTNGKLYSFSPSFSVATLAADSRYFGNKQGISIAEFTEYARNIPDGVNIDTAPTNWSIFGSFFMESINDFASKNEKRSRFDTPEFVDFLNYLDTFPNDRTVYEDEFDDTEFNPCVRNVHLYNAADYASIGVSIGLDNYTLIGYPSDNTDSNGAAFHPEFSLAMFSNSDKKEGILEFFNFLLSEEYQNSLDSSIPVKLDSLEHQANGNSEAIEYISSITKTDYYDVKLNNIVMEEMSKFFAGGASAEETAKAIQNRAWIYVNE